MWWHSGGKATFEVEFANSEANTAIVGNGHHWWVLRRSDPAHAWMSVDSCTEGPCVSVSLQGIQAAILLKVPVVPLAVAAADDALGPNEEESTHLAAALARSLGAFEDFIRRFQVLGEQEG